jgi:F-type H+-transporting ATPase subunit b
MKNWVPYLILTTNDSKNISLNTDILETNLINIIILLVLLIYLLGNFLNTNLSSRQEQIENTIKNGEKRLNEAKQRLKEAKFQWSQASIIIEEIKEQTKQTKVNLLESEYNDINQTLSQRFKNLLTILYYREQQVLSAIIQQVSEITLKQVSEKLKSSLRDKNQSNNKINRL